MEYVKLGGPSGPPIGLPQRVFLDSRPSKIQTLMSIADLWSARSTCLRGQVGCVIADQDGYVLSTGYNGAPAGMRHCSEQTECPECGGRPSTAAEFPCPACEGEGVVRLGCLIQDGRCVRSVHAEANAVASACRHGVSLKDGWLICTARSCLSCTNLLIQAGITKITWRDPYESDSYDAWKKIIGESGVRWEIYQR